MIECLSIVGGKRLQGEVCVSGAKNSALPLLMASLLTEEECIFHNVPDLEDIGVTARLLQSLGAEVQFTKGTFRVRATSIRKSTAPYSLVKSLRASFWVLGPLLARTQEARVALPGGDAIGTRPVDLHLKGLSQMGAQFSMSHGEVLGTVPGGLMPAEIKLDFPSVGATHQLLMAAAGIAGETVIYGVAREPEVVQLADLLSQMGAEIEGAGSSEIRVKGMERLGGAEIEVLGDRVEAATYLLAGAVTGGDVCVSGLDPSFVQSTLEVLRQMGCEISTERVESQGSQIRLRAPQKLRATSVETAPFPGLATDVQPLIMAAMTVAEGSSSINETIFENRFGHVAEYRRFGAEININGRWAEIKGKDDLSSAPVEAIDIRAAAGLVLMGLVAEGETRVTELHHLDRGYEGLVEKLGSLGAEIARVPLYEHDDMAVGC